MKVDLPNGEWAELLDAKEITEGQSRPILYAKNRTIAVSSRLLQRGYKPPEQWPKDLSHDEADLLRLKNLEYASDMSDADQEQMRQYQARLILGITKSWSFEPEVTEQSVLGLTSEVFDVLSSLCGVQFDKTQVSTDPDPNPPAPTDV